MPWNNCGDVNPYTTCLACGSRTRLEVYEPINSNVLADKQYWQECERCGCMSKFYRDESLEKYYCQIFKAVDLVGLHDLVSMVQDRSVVN